MVGGGSGTPSPPCGRAGRTMNEVGEYIAVLVAALLGLLFLTVDWDVLAHNPAVWVLGGYLGLCAVTHKSK